MRINHCCNSRAHQAIIGLITLCAGILPAPVVPAQPAPQVPAISQLTAGPAYTSADGKTMPRFPDADLVFSLRKADGSPIPIHPSDLALFSQNQQVGLCTGIRSFDRTGYGIAIVIAIDASGAMRAVAPASIDTAIATLTHQARPQDRTGVLTLAESSQIDLPFPTETNPSGAKLSALKPRGKSTRLFDGLLDALALFGPNAPRRRQLLVISDGRDQDSQHTLIDVILRARSLGVEVDAIGLTQSQDQALVTLQQLSMATGGLYLRAIDGAQLQQFIALGAAATRATPVAAFQLSHLPADGQIAPVQLRWLRGNLSAPAFIPTPNEPPLPFRPRLNPLLEPQRNPWLWGFGGCFLTGLLLFLLSLRSSKAPEIPAPHPAHPNPAPQPPAALPQRSPAPAANLAPYETPPTSKYKASYQPRSGQARYVEAEAERRKSEFSARFDAPPHGPFAQLVIRNNALAGKRVSMTSASFAVGALPGNDLVLPGDLTISGRHLRLYWDNSILTLEDNHSTNGTYLNRMRIPSGRHTLKPGDEIGIGQTFLLVERA